MLSPEHLCRQFPNHTGAGLNVLEVGAGTGRFATFFRDNYPRANLTVSDLSPFYLEKARENMAYWERMRVPRESSLGHCQFAQCAAELLPFEDESMDIVYNIYMFHEMPEEARNSALQEMARVLKPGGLLVITDSTQLGDRVNCDDVMETFEKLNEPHYPSYIRYDFGTAFKLACLKPELKILQNRSKSLSAIKLDCKMG
jgi:ubiquinone/menaquinone biosynthesis C-methylase UbiE